MKEAELSRIDSEASILVRILTEFIKRGGKRIRPALFYFASISHGGNKDDALMRSMAFEFFQTFCLIHDDLIDQSDLRRGKPTVHAKYDQATAILAGDMALMIADEIFFTLKCSNPVKSIYNRYKQEVLMGEYLDSIGSKNIQKVMDLKTARYTFVRPVELALQIEHLDQEFIDQWKKILHTIGMTFQLKDDLIGVFGDAKIIGKSSDSDLQEGKYTQLIALFEQKASPYEKQQFYLLFKKNGLSQDDSKILRNMLKSKKVPQQIKEQISQDITAMKQELQNIHEVALRSILSEILSEIEDMSMVLV